VRLVVGCATFAVTASLALSPWVRPALATGRDGDGGGTPVRALSGRFEREIWPLLRRNGAGCLGCHGEATGKEVSPSQLHLSPDSDASFHRLLAEGYFDRENPGSLLARLTAAASARRMPPPPAPAWSATEVARLRAFVVAVDAYLSAEGASAHADERFPAPLLHAYSGPPPQSGADTTFLSYRQLRGKIESLFGDRWQRNERDLFAENIEQLGGADFRRRFDESTRPAATFLAAVDLMARDVASRAYLARTGPFASARLPDASPLSLSVPDAAYRREIQRLYRHLLFRSASEVEVLSAFRFLQDLYRRRSSLASESADLTFELEARGAGGLTTASSFTLPVGRETRGIHQEFIDENLPSEETFARQKLDGVFLFRAWDRQQEFRISNTDTHGNVSLYAIELRPVQPAAGDRRLVIPVTDPSVRVEGAWRLRRDGEDASYEDRDDNKGESRIAIPIRVPYDGKYELTVSWRKGFGGRNAPRVLVEVLHHGPTRLAMPPAPPVPPRGEAHFYLNQTVDNIAFWDLKTAFRFASAQEGVEIQNAGTRNRVVADAVKFVPVGPGTTLLLDEDEADGREAWELFRNAGFRPYNVTGSSLISDGNRKKGELKLLYRPGRHDREWNPKAFYRVEVGFPGKADNETRAPVIVRASESAPILQLRRPQRAPLGATVTLDAGASYDLQRSALSFTWRQIGGPRVRISDPHAAQVTFQTVAKDAHQAAWEGLCRALLKHPDFLFTRPPSLDTVRDAQDRRRLQLVKVAQDLVARAPSEAEVRKLEQGAPLVTLVDDYLKSAEFRSFYFHRVRLYLESRGTEEEDEPARLWSYVAFNNRPFQEILTADYSVDSSFLKRPRPAYHGRTGLLTMKGFIRGKPGLPHFNYPAQVAEKFLGYVFEVPPEIVASREGITAAATTDPSSVCYSCHKVLTPLAYQRTAWTDDGEYRPTEEGKPVDDTDRRAVASYPFAGKGMEAFALQAQRKERFIRTMIQTHFIFYFGREMRYDADERELYRRLWDTVHENGFAIKGLIRALMTSPEYLEGSSKLEAQSSELQADGSAYAPRRAHALASSFELRAPSGAKRP
jgi:hypothetical protein